MALEEIRKRVFGPWGRATAALVGLGSVGFLLYHTGVQKVLETLSSAAPYFPIVLILEIAILGCSLCALRLLYGEDRFRIPSGALIRAGLIGYAVMGLFPAGRTAAESTRAALLARFSSAARAAVAAAQLQGITLLGNSAISFFAALATLHVMGFSLPGMMIVGNMVVTAILGFGILALGKSSRVGGWVSRWIPQAHPFGQKFDEHFSGASLVPLRPFLWEFFGRILQVLQNAVLFVAVGGKLGVIPALCSEALHLVGAAVGDLIPGQLGATEASYRLSAAALSLRPEDALSIALLAHLAQLFWVTVGLLSTVTRIPGRGTIAEAI